MFKNLGKDGESDLIIGKVLKQTSKTPYLTTLSINACRHVTQVSCNCVYGESHKCKHVAGLITFINNYKSVSKTDQEQQWGKPSTHQLMKEKYAKGAYVHEMFLPKLSLTDVDPVPLTVSDFTRPSALQLVVLEQLKNSLDHSLQKYLNTVEKNILLNKEKEECKVCIQHFLICAEKQTIYKNVYDLSKTAYQFYNSKVSIFQE